MRFQPVRPCTTIASSARVLKTYAELPKVLTKSELIEQVSELLKLPNGKAEQIVNCIFDSMVKALQEGDGIEIRGFGSFTVRQYKAYEGRNPRTGETVHVAPKRLPFFKVGKDLRERVNRGVGKIPLIPDDDDDDDDDIAEDAGFGDRPLGDSLGAEGENRSGVSSQFSTRESPRRESAGLSIDARSGTGVGSSDPSWD